MSITDITARERDRLHKEREQLVTRDSQELHEELGELKATVRSLAQRVETLEVIARL